MHVFAGAEGCVLVERVTRFSLVTNKCRGTAESVKAFIVLERPIRAQPSGEEVNVWLNLEVQSLCLPLSHPSCSISYIKVRDQCD